MKKRGILISFEGIDGSGKSTQAQLLRRYFRDRRYPIIFVREPGGTPTAEAIRRVLLEPRQLPMSPVSELLLFLAARADLVERVIKPAVSGGRVVIADRFSDSTFAYQCYGRGLDLNMVKRLNAVAAHGIKPDLTFLVDLHEREARKRLKKKKDRMESLSLQFHRRVRQGFLKIAETSPRRIRVLDGRESEDALWREVLQTTIELLRRRGIELPR